LVIQLVLQFEKPLVKQFVEQLVRLIIKTIKKYTKFILHIKLYYVTKFFSTKSEYNRNNVKY